MKISQDMVDALNAQINAELYSHYLYLSMSLYFAGQNLDGAAKWMEVQSREEYGHGMKIVKYVQERGACVKLEAIEKPQLEWNSPVDAFKDAYAHEIKVTGLIDALYKKARDEKDSATEIFLQWFVSEQVEEEDTVAKIVDRLEMLSGAPGGLFMFDAQLGARS